MPATKRLIRNRLKRAQQEMKVRWTAKLRCFDVLEDGPAKAALAVELFGSWSKEPRAAHKRGGRT